MASKLFTVDAVPTQQYYLIFVPSNERAILPYQRVLRDICIDFANFNSEPTDFDLVVCPTLRA